MTAILGISAFYHDSAAALVVDGRIVAAAQEERFTREQARSRLSRARAIAYCLREAGLDAGRPRLRRLLRQAADQVRAAAGNLPGLCPARASAASAWRCRCGSRTSCTCGGPSATASGGPTRARLVFTDHHESHAASAFFPSPFDEAAILTLDGVGEWSTTTFGRRRGQPDPS